MRYLRIPLWLPVLLWMPIFLVSLNHLYRFNDRIVIPMALWGVMFFLAIVATLLYLVQKYFPEALFVGLVFFCIGWLNGPFLEPPGDPLDHLEKVYSTCHRISTKFARANRGLWHYNMNGLALCSENPFSRSPEDVVIRIRFLHSLMSALLAAGLYAVGKSAGLPPFWAGLGVIITVLFMGTNRFSYFGYYSLAGSSSSLLIYWAWIAAFFFTPHQGYRRIVFAVLSALLLIPILYVNHVQEAIFLGFVCGVYVLIQFFLFVFSLKNRTIHWATVGAGLALFFILPQFEWFRDFLAPMFIINDWEKNQHIVFYMGPIQIMGKIWSYRVNDTLGLMGLLALPAAIAIIRMAQKEVISYKVAVVGVLPLLVYCIPLLHYIWLSNCRWLPTHTRYYYRICYASLFGVTFAYLFSQIEQRVAPMKWIESASTKTGRLIRKIMPSFKTICLTGLILLSTIRSGPVYGKLDFLTMDTNPWWPQWQPMLEELSKQNGKGKPIFTDAVTGLVLRQTFNYPILRKGPRPRRGHVDLDNLPPQKRYHTLLNLNGFTPSWVPGETGHWDPGVGNTARLYGYRGERGRQIRMVLDQTTLPGVQLFD